MIKGIGSDLANIGRVEQSIARFGERFVRRICSDDEMTEMQQRRYATVKDYAAAVSKRFAAKEACAKALGTGFRYGIEWKEIEVRHDKEGRPLLTLNGKALIQLQKICGTADTKVWLTLADDYPWAQAFVVIEVN